VTQPKPSKSARKREQLALQELGESLIGLSAEELRALPIDERLCDAVLAAASIRAHGALRRQKQLIGKLMRNVDAEPLRLALAARGADEALAKRLFADAERWRDRMLSGSDEAIDEFCEQTGAEPGPLRQLLGETAAAANEHGAKHGRRRVFRYVHDALLACTRDARIQR